MDRISFGKIKQEIPPASNERVGEQNIEEVIVNIPEVSKIETIGQLHVISNLLKSSYNQFSSLKGLDNKARVGGILYKRFQKAVDEGKYWEHEKVVNDLRDLKTKLAQYREIEN